MNCQSRRDKAWFGRNCASDYDTTAMIEIPLVQLVIVYLVVVIAIIGLSWWRGGRKRRRGWRDETECQVACRACGHVFHDRSLGQLAVCPHCGRPNERR